MSAHLAHLVGLRRPAGSVLTPREEQVAPARGGRPTNREIAAALLVSPKTVEVNVAWVHHKLGIRSRAELGALPAERPSGDGGNA